jgi:hypothetical protein
MPLQPFDHGSASAEIQDDGTVLPDEVGGQADAELRTAAWLPGAAAVGAWLGRLFGAGTKIKPPTGPKPSPETSTPPAPSGKPSMDPPGWSANRPPEVRPKEPLPPAEVPSPSAAAGAAIVGAEIGAQLSQPKSTLPDLPSGATVVDHGPHGPSVDGLQSRWSEALEWLKIAQTGEARGVLEHPEIEERIDVLWGEPRTATSEGYGLAKIIQVHPEILANLPERLAKMRIVQAGANRIRLQSEDGGAVISLNFRGDKKTWLLTAYEIADPKATLWGAP